MSVPARVAARTPLYDLLRERIRAGGPVTFCEYMAECLYHPEHGYYSRAEAGRFADYYTSVDVHPIFGRLLARQLAQMWDALGRPAEFDAVECGAGVGRLAAHILDFAARELQEFYGTLRYIAVEGSTARRAAQATHLAAHIGAGRAHSESELPQAIACGCIFSNELLDALPVHMVEQRDDALQEVYVALNGDRLVEQLGQLSTDAICGYFAPQNVTLREGQRAEAGLVAADWIETAGRALERGFVMTIDYGHEAPQLYDEHHSGGTLLAYQHHRVHEDFFILPGACDLTAHVNFTALDLWGRRAGLQRTGLVSQSHFLLALGRANEFADLYDGGEPETERVRARLLLKNLIHPEGMGETFRVMIQDKGVAAPDLTGLQPLQ